MNNIVLRRTVKAVSLGLSCFAAVFILFFLNREVQGMEQDIAHIVALFPQTPQELNELVEKAKNKFAEQINLLQAKYDKISLQDLMYQIDAAYDEVGQVASICQAFSMLSPDERMRLEGQKGSIELEQLLVEFIHSSGPIYKQIKQQVALQSSEYRALSDSGKYCVDETCDEFKRAGLDHDVEIQDKIKALQKELVALSTDFEQNISNDIRQLTLTAEQLSGVGEPILSVLKRDEKGNYLVSLDYPTYFAIMDQCKIAETRKVVGVAFSQKAFPVNEPILERMRTARHELATLLGYQDYASFDLEPKMAQNVGRVRQFLTDIADRVQEKERQELELFKQHLPEGVTLLPDGKISPWDTAYICNHYKIKYCNLDEEALSAYFPIDNTINVLLSIYEQFFKLSFKRRPISGLWVDGLELISVYKAEDNTLIGHVIMDLHPRPNKYSHACQMTIIGSRAERIDQLYRPGVALLVTNFTKPTHDRPSLLCRREVTTFFHEFGHVLHALLGATELASFSGTRVKRDFVELPSQMLEEWLFDPQILKMVSCHYKTGESLSDQQIEKILRAKNVDSGIFLMRQLFYAFLSLELFQKEFMTFSADDVMRKLYAKYRPLLEFDENNKTYASFGHLTGYGAGYYGYLWSKVYALDLVSVIKKYGLLNPEIGQKYASTVLQPGGSIDPNELLFNFLGRAPIHEPFFEDLGLV